MTALAQMVGIIGLGSIVCYDLGFSETWGEALLNLSLLLLGMVVGLGVLATA
jgi:hypothetical protein